MLCEKCGTNEANVQVQAFAMDGQSKTMHLCSACLAKQQAEMAGGANFAEFMGSLFGRIAERMKNDEEKYRAVCPDCGLTYKDFTASGMLGCSGCYAAFREKVEEVLLKRNGSVKYVSQPCEGGESRRSRIRRLRSEMKTAIETENYEQAAQLRDEIHQLEEQV